MERHKYQGGHRSTKTAHFAKRWLSTCLMLKKDFFLSSDFHCDVVSTDEADPNTGGWF